MKLPAFLQRVKPQKPIMTPWQATNLGQLLARTAFQASLPQGIIYSHPSAATPLHVQREGDQLQLFFYSNHNCEVMSRMDVHHPLNLVSPYTQAMMLSLLWQPNPQQIYMLGFGAGRVPMVMHHHLPEALLECTELDPNVVAIAESHFGIQPDERLKVFIQDGRGYLEEKNNSIKYDIILIDAFSGTGSSPPSLSTVEFFALCKKHMAQDGLLAVNLLLSDRFYDDKIYTLKQAFKNIYKMDTSWGGTVFLATDHAALSHDQLVQKAIVLENQYGFAFSFAKHARQLQPLHKPARGRLLNDHDLG